MKGLRSQVVKFSDFEGNKYVLDVACGGGAQSLLYASRGAKAVGIDLSGDMLRIARANCQEYPGALHYIQGDATKLPFAENRFDISTIALALHETEHGAGKEMLKELARVTKPSGKIIIADFAVYKGKNIKGRIWAAVIPALEKLAGGEHYRYYSDFMSRGGVAGLESLARKCNLEMEELKIVQEFSGGNLGLLRFRKT
jgi:ubiquinone/menaquinone biosynthesis C-methylase UbiE